MDFNELKEKVKGGAEKIFSSSKKALGKAGTAVQEFSDKSVIKIEKHQFETKKNEQFEKLGKLAFEKFKDNDSAVLSASEETVVAIREEIANLDKEIAKREELLKKTEKDKTENN